MNTTTLKTHSIISYILVLLCIIFFLFILYKITPNEPKESEYIKPFNLTFNDENLKKELLDKINKTGDLTYGSIIYNDSYSIISRQDNIKAQQARYTIIDIVLNDKICPPMLVSLKDNDITVEAPFFKKIDFSKSFINECAIQVIKNSTTEMKNTSELKNDNLQSWKN